MSRSSFYVIAHPRGIAAWVLLCAGLALLPAACAGTPEPWPPDAAPPEDAALDLDAELDWDTSLGCVFVPDGDACPGDRICVGGSCVRSSCGDGFVDGSRGEECDDQNFIDDDRCDNECKRNG